MNEPTVARETVRLCAMWHERKKILARVVSAHCFQCPLKVSTQTRYFHFDSRLSHYVIP